MKGLLQGEDKAGFFLVNVGDSYISAEFISINQKSQLTFVTGSKVDIDKHHKKLSGGHSNYYHLKKILLELNSKIDKADRRRLANPNVLCVYLPSPAKSWIISSTISQKEPFPVTPRVLASMVYQAEQGLQGWSLNEGDYADKRVMSVFINGYPVDSYMNRMARDLKVDLFFSLTEAKMRKPVLHAIYAGLPGTSIQESTFQSHLLNFVSNNFFGKSGLLACLLPGVTTMVYLREGRVSYMDTFDYGEQDIVKFVSSKISSTPAVCRSYLELFFENKLHGKSESRIKDGIDEAVKDYYFKLNEYLASSAAEHIFGGSISILPTNRLGNFFAKLIAGSNLKLQSYMSAEAPKVFEYSDSHHYINEEGRVYDNMLGVIETSSLIV